MVIHYDNAPSHNAKSVNNYLLNTSLTLMPHPCYSPDLAPCDFGVFGTVKESFEGQEFETEDEILSAIEDFYIQKVMNFGCHFLKVGRNDFKSALIKKVIILIKKLIFYKIFRFYCFYHKKSESFPITL